MPEARAIRALVADDEPLARRGIRQLLGPHPDVVIAAECRDGREALAALGAGGIDLVFLDVQMPELDGLGVLRELGAERMPSVVFVTAYDEFAVRAFESCALDYLVKPVTQVRFDATMARVRQRLRAEDAVALAARLTRLLSVDGQPSRRIPVSTPEGTRLLDHTEIDWIQADDYYAIVHAGGARYLLRESLSSLEERLDPARFARVHRSALVAVDRVRELRTGNGDSLVVLRDGTRIPVSRRRREALSARLRARPDRSPHGDDRSRTSG